MRPTRTASTARPRSRRSRRTTVASSTCTRGRRRLPERTLERSQVVPAPLDDAFAFYADASNLEAITPRWLRFRIVTPRPIEMRSGTLIEYRLRLHGIPVRWRTMIVEWEPGVRFVDRQIAGPFAAWEHTHSFAAVDGGTLIRDVVRYRMPFGPVGALAHALLIRRDLERIFDHRREAVERQFAARLDSA